jgi:outer membrane protein assembly factor BamB
MKKPETLQSHSRLMKTKVRKILWAALAGLGHATLLGQPKPGTVLWSYDTGSRIWTSPTVATNGAVYIGTDFGLCAITNNGSAASNLWIFAAPVASSCSVASDGAIYFGDRSQDVNLNAVNPDGSRRWALPLQPRFQYQIVFQSTPALGFSNTVYFAAGGELWAASNSGLVLWHYRIEDPPGSYPLSPALGPDGTIYIGSYAQLSTLYAVQPDGTLKWSVGVATGSGEAPAVGNDGTVYVAAGPLYAFAPDGTNLWSLGGGSAFDGTPIIGKDSTIYVAGYLSHTLYAFSPAGQEIWHNLAGGRIPSSTAAATDTAGVVYYCATNSVVALSPQGQILWWVSVPPPAPGIDGAMTSPTIGPDGTIYAALGTTLYAIASGTNAPANSAWPMYQQNARHTGKIERPTLKQPQKRSDANFQFQLFPQQVGLTYTIESSTNLNTWTALTSIVASTLPTDVVDLTASNVPIRLYRATSTNR